MLQTIKSAGTLVMKETIYTISQFSNDHLLCQVRVHCRLRMMIHVLDDARSRNICSDTPKIATHIVRIVLNRRCLVFSIQYTFQFFSIKIVKIIQSETLYYL